MAFLRVPEGVGDEKVSLNKRSKKGVSEV